MNKIAIFLPSLGGGGAERGAVNLAAGFLGRGYAVDFVLVWSSGSLSATLPEGVQVINLHAHRALTALPGLVKYLRKNKPQGLISALDHINLVAIWAKILSGTSTQLLITAQNQLSMAIKNSRKIQEKIYPFLLHLFYRRADAIIAVSKGVADDVSRIARIPRTSIRTIYNSFLLDEIDRLGSKPPDHPWFAPGEPPVILSTGRLTAQKDYPTLLRAFASLRKHRPVRLVILGEGEQRAQLEVLANYLGIQDDLDLPGFVDPPYPLMAHCQVFALSSAWEGFGNVLVEALACGAQIVSTNCPSGPAEILDDGKYGHLVPVGDVVALERAIEDALDHPIPVEGLKERAKAFSGETAVCAYLQVLGLPSYDH